MPSPLEIEFPMLRISRMPLSYAHFAPILGASSIALPIAYIVYLKRCFGKQTESLLLISPPASLDLVATSLDLAIASKLDAPPNDFVLARETLKSLPIRTADLNTELQNDSLGLLNTYIRTTMQAFSWTPQAMLMHFIIKDPAAKHTFDVSYLVDCNFQASDRVCGVYVVSSRSDERITLDLDPPVGWIGPIVKGCIVVGLEKAGGDEVRFVNETVLWRGKNEKPTVLESAFGRWMHGFMISWMVVRGVAAVTGERRKNS